MIKPRPTGTNPEDYVDWYEDLFRLLRDEHLGPHHVKTIARIALGEEEVPEEWRAK